jgi:outer membrane protein TolC
VEGTIKTDASADRWWRLYQDPVLDGLVADALAANTDVRASVARLQRARASLREVGADRLPGSDLQAGVNRQRSPLVQTLPGINQDNTVVDGGISVAYEVDLFGRVRRGVEAARGEVGAAQADLDAVKVSVVADTTRAYIDAASAAQRLAVAEHIVDILDRRCASHLGENELD